jgi:lysine decarboxylase
MPGHIGGAGFIVKELKALAAIDITEVPGLDDLHLPLEVIDQGQLLLAQAFGAKRSCFLVNGATSGIQSLLLSLNPGDKILVSRNAHRSLFGGMVLSGVIPVYIPCQIDGETGVTLSVTGKSIEELLLLNNDIKAVFVTSPTYYGTVVDIKNFSEIAIDRLLFVDEAHGAHFPFHSSYPEPAIKNGADAAVNGLHKTLPVLNQGACLHLADRADSFLNQDRLLSACSLLTTTSPSYPILASIDLARKFMQEQGENYLERALHLSNEYKVKINRVRGLRCYGEELKCFPGVMEIDPLKLLISVEDMDINGFQMSYLLRYQYNIQVEMQETNIILAMMSMFHERNDWDKLYHALLQIARDFFPSKKKKNSYKILPDPRVRLSPREAFFADKRKVSFNQSCGLISGEIIASYPPGIPCILPGEEISPEVFSYINYLKRSGAHIQGPKDPSLNYVNIID